MANLPFISNGKLVLDMDPTRGYHVNTLGTAKITGVTNRVNGLAMLQSDPTKQVVVPAKNKSAASVLTFTGTESLTYNQACAAVNAYLAGSFTIFCVATIATPSSGTLQTLVGFTGTNAENSLNFQSSKTYLLSTDNASSTANTTGTKTIDTKKHVFTLVRDAVAGTLLVRVDGVQDAKLTGRSGATTYTGFTMGGIVNPFLGGSVERLLVYVGAVSELSVVENYLAGKDT